MSILSDEMVCYICGSTWQLEKHHVFGASNRNKSEEDGCTCYLCRYHHTGSSMSVHMNSQLAWDLKRKTQLKWMETYNKTEEDFRRRYGRSYL